MPAEKKQIPLTPFVMHMPAPGGMEGTPIPINPHPHPADIQPQDAQGRFFGTVAWLSAKELSLL